MPNIVLGTGDMAMDKKCGIYKTEILIKGMDPKYIICQIGISNIVKNKPGVF